MNAVVTWNAPGGIFRTTLSDGAGYFSFTNVPLGVVKIHARTSYAELEREVTLTGDTVIDMVLAPRKYLLYGRITDVISGVPFAGATVSVIVPASARDPRNAGRSTTSGGDGAYRLPDIWTEETRLRVHRPGYDPVLLTVQVFRDTQQDIQMRAAQQTLAGTWTGEMTATGVAGGTPQPTGVTTLRQTGATIEADQPFSFTGTLAALTAIGATTQIAGTLTITRSRIGQRIPPPPRCVGTGRFTGTANWTRFFITAPQVTFVSVPAGAWPACEGTESVTLSLVR